MNLSELSDLIGRATDVLRVETLDAYSSASDGDMVAAYLRGDPKPDPAAKRPWLDRLAAAAERGHPWRRLRVVSRPVPDYVRYACEWGYVDNAAAGEDIRVLDEAVPARKRGVAALRRFGDFYVLDGDLIAMTYTRDGEFHRAERRHPDVMTPESVHRIVEDTERVFLFAVPFTEWWAANPDLHRDLVTS